MPPGCAWATARAAFSVSQGKSGSASPWKPTPLLVVRLGRQRGDERVVEGDLAHLGRHTRGAEGLEELHVRVVVLAPLFGEVLLVVDRLHGADRLAGPAVHALVGVNVQGTLALVDAVHGTLVHAGLVLQVHTRQCDDIGHCSSSPRFGRSVARTFSHHGAHNEEMSTPCLLYTSDAADE